MVNINMPIGKLFKIEKGQLQSTKCSHGKFDFITATEDWKTHNQYNHECEALIFAAAASGPKKKKLEVEHLAVINQRLMV